MEILPMSVTRWATMLLVSVLQEHNRQLYKRHIIEKWRLVSMEKKALFFNMSFLPNVSEK